MSIEKRKTAKGHSYRVRIFEKGLIVNDKTFPTKALAVEWERKEAAKLQLRKAFPERPLPVTLSALFETWVEVHAQIYKAASSQVKDKQMFKTYLDPRFGGQLVNDITEESIQQFIIDLRKKGNLSNNSINKILQLFKSLLNFSLKKRMIQFNPMFGMKLLPVGDEAYSYWSRDEASRFLSFANIKYQGEERWKYALYLLLLTTGVRIREAVAIYWDRINFDTGIIEISQSYDRFQKKIKQETKGKKIRYVPLDDELKKELLALRSKSRSRLVFTTKNGGIVDADNFRNRVFYKDEEAIGLRKIKVHDLRHTYASNYMMSDGNGYDLKAILGHADYKMTQRYAHLSPSHIASKASVVNYETDLLLKGEGVVRFVSSVEPRPLNVESQSLHSPNTTQMVRSPS